MFGDLWGVFLNPVFLIMFGLVLFPFAPLAWSVYRTWEDNRVTRRRTAVVVTTEPTVERRALADSPLSEAHSEPARITVER